MGHVATSSVLDLQDMQARFMAMVPQIQRRAQRAFRACTAELREEIVAEVVADCFIWYRRLVELGRINDAHANALAHYSIKRIASGVQVGCRRNRFDTASRYARLKTGMRREPLYWRDSDTGEWHEMLLEAPGASPADLAAARIDIRHWFSTLSIRNRAIAVALAAGERTHRVAEQFGLSSGRIAQMRREFAKSWLALHGLGPNGREPSLATA